MKNFKVLRRGFNWPIFIILTATLVVSGFFIFINKAQATTLEVCLEEGCNYTSIQSAINEADAGDTINVADGTYTITAAININKGVIITGNVANPGNVLVKYSPASSTLNCVEVNSADVTIQGIKVQDCKNGFYFDRSVNTNTGVTISNCIIESVSGWGIGEISSPNTVISHNTITNAGDKGIIFRLCEGTSESNRCEAISNVISGCERSAIQTFGSKYAYIYDNTISSTNDKGINIIRSGTGTADRIQVIGNIISETKWPGIQVIGAPYTYVYDNTLTKCNYYGSDGTGDWDYASIHVQDDIGPTYSHHTVIDSNTVSDGINGIQTWSNDVTITNNEVYDMGKTYADTKTVGTRLYKNSAILVGSNWGSGDIDPTGVVIENNNIHDNYWGLFYSTDLTNGVIAEYNYWGCPEEPSNVDCDVVSANVDFVPFYTDEAMEVLSTSYSVCASGCNFATIQDSIDAASSGDTINVAAGTYEEQVVIDKQLTLNGANVDVNAVTGARGSESIIDGGTSTAITISADNVIVDGFTLDGGITLDDLVNFISGGAISNNIITGADETEGIKAQNGIRLGFDKNGKGVDGVTIENNIISNSLCKGIRFSNTKLDGKDPHDPQRISNITISGNEIKDNGSAGMETYGPGSNTIINNTISNNDGNGINLKFDDGDEVRDNIITDNDGPGITLRDVTNSLVENNSISDHKSDKVFKEFESGGGEGSKGSGIHIVFASENNTIRYNNISDNNYGIFIHRGNATDKGQPSSNSFAQNKIVKNKKYGIFNALVGPPTAVNAIGNYWDDETGPGGVASGSGDFISENVDYSPWYTDDELTSLKAPIAEDTETGNKVLVLEQSIDIISNDIIVSMPAGITITATASWEGVIDAPSIKSEASDTPPRESGYNTTIDTIIEIGYSNIKLVFNKAVRILIPNQAGKQVGYVRPGEDFQEITNFCLDDIQTINDDLPPEGNCKIDAGNDLAVWTKHFTQFIVYSYSPIIIGPTFRAVRPSEEEPEEKPSALSEEAQKLDTNKDDKIDDLDLKELFTNWGSIILDNIADFNNDSKVDVFDFNLLMVHWTE